MKPPQNLPSIDAINSNNPKMVLQSELPYRYVRSNPFELNTSAYSVLEPPKELRVGKIEINAFTLTSTRLFEGQKGFLLFCILC